MDAEKKAKYLTSKSLPKQNTRISIIRYKSLMSVSKFQVSSIETTSDITA